MNREKLKQLVQTPRDLGPDDTKFDAYEIKDAVPQAWSLFYLCCMAGIVVFPILAFIFNIYLLIPAVLCLLWVWKGDDIVNNRFKEQSIVANREEWKTRELSPASIVQEGGMAVIVYAFGNKDLQSDPDKIVEVANLLGEYSDQPPSSNADILVLQDMMWNTKKAFFNQPLPASVFGVEGLYWSVESLFDKNKAKNEEGKPDNTQPFMVSISSDNYLKILDYTFVEEFLS